MSSKWKFSDCALDVSALCKLEAVALRILERVPVYLEMRHPIVTGANSEKGVPASAQRAADRNACAGLYQSVSMLGAFEAEGLGRVRDSRGETIGDADKARSRWEEHFFELLGGDLCESVFEARCVFTRCVERSHEEKRWLAEITAPLEHTITPGRSLTWACSWT